MEIVNTGLYCYLVAGEYVISIPHTSVNALHLYMDDVISAKECVEVAFMAKVTDEWNKEVVKCECGKDTIRAWKEMSEGCGGLHI